ncbi:MAG: BrnT family toxin [Alphaproteobacteria bacterium]|nr:BrnT family toxin [Alphaproteobacteria bacterium]
MDFESDEAKSDWTRPSRGFSFDDAARIFDGPIIVIVDDRQDHGEARLIALGMTNQVVPAVVYTDRGNVRRDTSARRVSRRERMLWQSFARA